jgi:hypothetical protein
MINAANKRIEPNLGNLMVGLKQRLSDSNTKLVEQTLRLLSLLATVRNNKE